MTNPTTQPTAMPALARLLATSTARPWHYGYDGPSMPIISAKPADGFIAFVRDADGQQGRAEANAALLALAANRLEELVATVEKQLKHVHVLHSWVAPLEECKSSICTNARSLLAAIEAEAAAAIDSDSDGERRWPR